MGNAPFFPPFFPTTTGGMICSARNLKYSLLLLLFFFSLPLSTPSKSSSNLKTGQGGKKKVEDSRTCYKEMENKASLPWLRPMHKPVTLSTGIPNCHSPNEILPSFKGTVRGGSSSISMLKKTKLMDVLFAVFLRG